MNSGRKKIYAGLDVGKFACAFFILFYHYFSEHGPLPEILDEMLSLYAVAVALFMTISGFLLFDKLETVDDGKGRWEIVKKQAIRIYRIYLIWSIPYLIFNISRWDWNTISLEFIFWQIQGWIFKSTFYTIWFMPVLAIGLILTFWITEKFSKEIAVLLAIICWIIGALLSTYNFIGIKIPNFTTFSIFADTWMGGARGWTFYAFPLLMVGRFMVKVKNHMRPMQMVLLSCICMLVLLGEALLLRFLAGGHTGIDLAMMMIPTVFCVLGFLISIPLPKNGPYVWMRKMSTLVFMSQRIFLTVLPAMFPAVFAAIFQQKYIGGILVVAFVYITGESIILGASRYKMMKLLY